MSRLAELLVEWEERWEAGEPITVEELCAQEPDLRAPLEQQITQLQRFRAIEEPADAVPRLPAAIGSYTVKQILGAGATGIVYLAKDRSLQRKVAIKVLSPRAALISAADRHRLAERFRLEARVIARLRHPAIVPIFEAELDHGEPYYVMEFLPGGSLQDRLRAAPGQPLGTPRDIAAFMAQVTAAVCHAHAHGVAHRDLKPGNILLDAAGSPKVTDFGLAKLIDDALWHDDSSAPIGDHRVVTDEPSLTNLGRQPGTPAYMAPEQFDLSIGIVGLPADLWALGVILYELLVDRRPFTGECRDELRRTICEEPLAPPHVHKGGVDPTLERLTLRCLNRAPEKRPTAAELLEALERCLRPGPVQRLASALMGVWKRKK